MGNLHIPESRIIQNPSMKLEEIARLPPQKLQELFSLDFQVNEVMLSRGVEQYNVDYFLGDHYTGYTKIMILPKDEIDDRSMLWGKVYPLTEELKGKRYGTFCQYATILKMIEKGIIGPEDWEWLDTSRSDDREIQLSNMGLEDGVIKDNLKIYSDYLETKDYALNQ